MAKRKKSSKTTTRRRRRSVGAVNKSLLTMAAGAIVGQVAGGMLAGKIAPTMDMKIKGAILAAGGLFGVPMFMKSPFGSGLAIGLAGAGVGLVLSDMGILAGVGYSSRRLYNPRQISGVGDGVNAMVNGYGNGVNALVNGRQTVGVGMPGMAMNMPFPG